MHTHNHTAASEGSVSWMRYTADMQDQFGLYQRVDVFQGFCHLPAAHWHLKRLHSMLPGDLNLCAHQHPATTGSRRRGCEEDRPVDPRVHAYTCIHIKHTAPCPPLGPTVFPEACSSHLLSPEMAQCPHLTRLTSQGGALSHPSASVCQSLSALTFSAQLRDECI